MRGNHTEDIKIIPPAEFGDLAPVADAIRAGEDNAVKIARRCKDAIALDEVSAMFSGQYEALYESAMWAYIDAYRTDWIRNHASASPEDIIRFIDKTRREWTATPPKCRRLGDMILDYFNVLDERKNKKTAMTGVKDLDELTGGIHPGELTAIGARPGTGKSAFCLQTAVNVARSGRKVMFFALEMTEAQNLDRLMMMHARGIDQKQLRDGDLDEAQWDETYTASEKIKAMDETLLFSQQRDISQIKRMVADERPDLLVIDQLSQVTDETQKFPSIRERYIYMTKELMDIAMNSGVAVWVACQVNRGANDMKPSLANLKESGSIEEDCDMVILLHRDRDEEEARSYKKNRIINVEVAKHRGGEPGEFKLKFTPKRFSFAPIEDVPDGYYETQSEIEF